MYNKNDELTKRENAHFVAKNAEKNSYISRKIFKVIRKELSEITEIICYRSRDAPQNLPQKSKYNQQRNDKHVLK